MWRIVVAGGALAVIVAVFWLKVEHAKGVCADAHGRWADSDCYFDEPGGLIGVGRVPFNPSRSPPH